LTNFKPGTGLNPKGIFRLRVGEIFFRCETNRSSRRLSFHSAAQAQANAYHEQMKANYAAAYAANPYLLHPQIMAMNAFASAANPHPPNLVEVQTLLKRYEHMTQGMQKVPSLKELNARAPPYAPPGVVDAAHAHAALPPAVKVPPPVAAPTEEKPAVAGAGEEDKEGMPAPCAGKVCANCRTTKTPLWRNGPLGPKTLCNACGVRFKLGKLPPPGGWPPGHVPPPAPPRKRPALLDSNGQPVKRSKAEKGALEKDGEKVKKKRRPRLAPDLEAEEGGEYLRAGKVAKSSALLTDYDGAVLLMVLAGMYSH